MMILLGCAKLDLLISKFDGKTINGVTFKYVSRNGIQAKFEHDAEDNETAINAAKMFFHMDPDLKQYLTSAMECYD